MIEKLINKVILVGRLTSEPEVKATASGVYVANLRLATNTYGGKDEEGNAKQQTEFHQLAVFGKSAEFAGQYLHKGSQIYAEGRLKTSNWADTAGQKHYRTEIVLDVLKALGSRSQEAAA